MCTCLSDNVAIMAPPLMILDELDSGVGARLGKSIGRLLRRMGGTQLSTQHLNTHQLLSLQSELSQQHQLGAQQQSNLQPEPERMTQHQLASASQILCVSHLPQVSTCFRMLCTQSHCQQICIPRHLHSLHACMTTACWFTASACMLAHALQIECQVFSYSREASFEKHAQQLHDNNMVDSIGLVYAYVCVRGIAWCRLQHTQITIFV